MARHLYKTEDGLKEVISDRTQCRWLYDGICCNDECDMVADMPVPEIHCRLCRYFTKERKG